MNFKSLSCVRETTKLLLENPESLNHFTLHLDRLSSVSETVLSLIQRDYVSPKDIPAHSRWRHFEASTDINRKTIDRINPIIENWKKLSISKDEIIKRLLDLFVISVLLDAGAGSEWKYSPKDEPNSVYTRSEGLALASLDWFMNGGFSSDSSNPYQVDSTALKLLTVQDLKVALQVSDSNPLIGEDRVQLLIRLGAVCEALPKYFGVSPARPGNMLNFLISHPSTSIHDKNNYQVQISTLWDVIINGFSGVWPSTRTILNGKSLGDVWPCEAIKNIHIKNPDNELAKFGLVAFHKLSQWLTYSLMEPLCLYGINFIGIDQMTGLAEYRNGGLFVDMGVLELKSTEWNGNGIPKFNVHDDVVVEWRALTVGLLDLVGAEIRNKLQMSEEELPLVKILEAGTWKAGREIAFKKRPETRGPPIEIISDGTVF